jgi:6-pyruvoyltetrahydropterin/6-carboxytetrahydropterin synthase
MKRLLVITSEFSSAHFYKDESMTVNENKKAFGDCYTEFGHGHNYKIEAGFEVKPSLKDRDLVKTKTYLEKSVTDLTNALDHEHLNFVIPEFKKRIPTTENILLYFEKKILDLKLKNNLAFIKLFESENLYSEKSYVTVY